MSSRLLQEARDGRSAVLDLSGEPGIGKTARSAYQASQARSSCEVEEAGNPCGRGERELVLVVTMLAENPSQPINQLTAIPATIPGTWR